MSFVRRRYPFAGVLTNVIKSFVNPALPQDYTSEIDPSFYSDTVEKSIQ